MVSFVDRDMDASSLAAVSMDMDSSSLVAAVSTSGQQSGMAVSTVGHSGASAGNVGAKAATVPHVVPSPVARR